MVPEFRLLGVRVDAVQIPEAVARIRAWIAQKAPCRYVAVTGMHGIMEAQDDPEFRAVLADAGLTLPDGMPLVWLARRRGHPLRRRVYGPELMETFCRETAEAYRHFFYGGAPGVAADLARTLGERFKIRVVGVLSPPFRDLGTSERQEIADAINLAHPDLVWVGLSTPKQERWMAANAASLTVPAMIGVGAAFDFLSGRKAQAPKWMREHGLEWLFRLVSEPSRLWRRYLVQGGRFVALVAAEEARRYRGAER